MPLVVHDASLGLRHSFVIGYLVIRHLEFAVPSQRGQNREPDDQQNAACHQ